MPDWALAYLDRDNEPAPRGAWIDVNDGLGEMLMHNAPDLYGERFAIMREDSQGAWRQVAYSIPYDASHVAENEQPIYTIERVDTPWLADGKLINARGFRNRELRFHVQPAPEHRVYPFPMATTKVRGATYPAELATLTDHFRDSSWKNDVLDSVTFAIRGTPYTMWIQHPSPLLWDEEGPPQRYELTPLVMKDDGEELSLEEALDAHHPGDEADGFDDPEDLLEYIRSMAEDDATKRARMLELGPKRKSYDPKKHGPEFTDAEQRYALLEPYTDDLDVNPSRRRRVRRNPSDVEAAKEKFEEFHRHKPRKVFESAKSPIPAKVRELGKAKAVLYRSDKNDPDTGRAVKRPINYIHDHDAGVRCFTPAAGGTVPVPAFIKDAEALVLLGKCLGFDFEDEGGVREAKGIKPLPDLYATPCGKALLVIQDRRDVLAIIWGGGLGVEARGIVG